MGLSPYQSIPLSKCTFHSICFTVDSDSNLRVLTVEDRENGELVKNMTALELLDKSLKYNSHLTTLAKFIQLNEEDEAQQEASNNGLWTKAPNYVRAESYGITGSTRGRFQV